MNRAETLTPLTLSVLEGSSLAPQVVCFDRVARSYRLLEHLLLGQALSRTRTKHLPALGGARRALVLGDGDGRFLAALLRHNQVVQALAVDSSKAMLRLLAYRCRRAAGRLTLRHADALSCLGTLSAEAVFDLVATHFFLDCFSDATLRELIPAVRHHLKPGALWVVSEFRVPPSGFLRLPARLLVRGLYLAFRLLTGLTPTRLPAYAPLLEASGLKLRSETHELGGLLAAELWELPRTS